MTTMTHGSISYGKRRIDFNILFVDRRTLEIGVFPDASVVVKAPLHTPYEEIRKRVSRRARWICRQISYFNQFIPRTPPRQYLSGETHLYLGRRYRLKVQPGNENEVKLQRGYLFVFSKKDSKKAETVKSLLDKWYADKARARLHESFERCWEIFSYNTDKKPSVSIRRMKTRWGSLSENGVLTLNIDLIRAPQECIDYVITHELCHLRHHDHSPAFFKLLDKVMPDWEQRKHKLELSLI